MLSVVEAMIGLGKRLRLDVICEGIETKEQLSKLRSLGDVSVQGYYIARPMDAGAMLQWLRANGAERESGGIRSSAA